MRVRIFNVVSDCSPGSQRFNLTDSTNTLQAITTNTALYSAGVPCWLLFAFDFATNTRCVYLTETSQTVASLTLTGNFNLADAAPIFLSSNEIRSYRPLSNPFDGSIGYLGFWDKYVDWTNATNRRALYATDGTPATRTPYAAIGGQVPAFELWGGKGDWAWGTPDGSNSVKMLSAAHRIRTAMT